MAIGWKQRQNEVMETVKEKATALGQTPEQYRQESIEYAHTCGIGLYMALLREGKSKAKANEIAKADATRLLRQMLSENEPEIGVLGQY